MPESPVKDKNYNLTWFLEQCLHNTFQLEEYIQDAEQDGDDEVANLLRRAQEHSRKGGDQAKRLLASRLQSEET